MFPIKLYVLLTEEVLYINQVKKYFLFWSIFFYLFFLSLVLFWFSLLYIIQNAYLRMLWSTLQHQYRDGHLEEVVPRHLGHENGRTLIAKNIRLHPSNLLSSFFYDDNGHGCLLFLLVRKIDWHSCLWLLLSGSQTSLAIWEEGELGNAYNDSRVSSSFTYFFLFLLLGGNFCV